LIAKRNRHNDKEAIDKIQTSFNPRTQKRRPNSLTMVRKPRGKFYFISNLFSNKITNVYLKQNPKSTWAISDTILGPY
jgi:hypothetical protein